MKQRKFYHERHDTVYVVTGEGAMPDIEPEKDTDNPVYYNGNIHRGVLQRKVENGEMRPLEDV